VVVAMVALVTAVPPAGAAPTKTKTVTGSLHGAGDFLFSGGCLIVAESAGTYRAKHLGRGTYQLGLCVTSTGPLHVVGGFQLVTRAGAQLDGTIDADLPNALQSVPVTITGGTERFAGATGNLVLAITEFNQTNCDPRVGICLNWEEQGTITGTITPAR
jgi:hypothetical protein